MTTPWPAPTVCTTIRADRSATVMSSAVRLAVGVSRTRGGTR